MNWKRAAIAAAFAVPVILLFAWGFTRSPDEIKSPLPGHNAPQFALGVFSAGEPPLTRPVGDTVRLASLRGKVVVLNFWASWCLSCRDEHVGLTQTARLYSTKPVQFLGVLYDDAPSNALDWIKEMGGQSYPAVNDPDKRTAIDFGLYGVPETFVIDTTGRIARKFVGPVPPVELARLVDSLLGPGVDATGGAAASAKR